jgi:hypothetical protein
VISLLLLATLVVVVIIMETEKNEDSCNTDERLKEPEGAIKNLARK